MRIRACAWEFGMATGGTVSQELISCVVVLVLVFVSIVVISVVTVYLEATKPFEFFIEASKGIVVCYNVVSITVSTLECCCNKLSVGAASSSVTGVGGIDQVTVIRVVVIVVSFSVVVVIVVVIIVVVVVVVVVVAPLIASTCRGSAIILSFQTKRIGETFNT
jgi:hypothetical protein